jgi:hypothetical protein
VIVKIEIELKRGFAWLCLALLGALLGFAWLCLALLKKSTKTKNIILKLMPDP